MCEAKPPPMRVLVQVWDCNQHNHELHIGLHPLNLHNINEPNQFLFHTTIIPSVKKHLELQY